MSKFEISDRLNKFYANLLDNTKMNLWEFVKLCLMLSHGDTRVESGLSLNNQILDENLRESSLVAERIVYEGIQNEGRVMNVNIDKLMLKYVEDYSKAYKKAVDENRKKQTAGERRNEKRHLNNKLKVSKKAKKERCCLCTANN